MRRFLILLMVTMLVGGLLGTSSEAGKRRRTESVLYTNASCLWAADVCWGGLPGFGGPIGWQRDPAENLVRISVEDASGLPIGLVVTDGEMDRMTVCGQTDKPIRLGNNSKLFTHPFLGLCDDAPSIPTSGTITVTFIRD